MNTNYSKIALLLALGAVAGEVGATIDLSARSLEDLNSLQRKNVVKNEYLKGFKKTKENTTALRNIDNNVSQIFSPIGCANNHLLSSKNWVGVDGSIVQATDSGAFAKKILGIATSKALSDYVANNEALDSVRLKLDTLESNFDKDIKAIEAKALTNGNSFDFFAISNPGTAKGLKDFIDASQSKDKTVSNVVKGVDAVISALKNMTARSTKGDQLLGELAGMIYRMTKQVGTLGTAPVEVNENNVKSNVDIRTGLDNTVNALKDLFANYSGHYADLPAAADADQEIEKMAKRHKVISEKLSKVHFASSAGMKNFLSTFLNTGLNVGTLKTTLDKVGTDKATKDGALRVYMSKVFGEATGDLDKAAAAGRVFEYKNADGGVASAADAVTPGEVNYALGLNNAAAMVAFEDNTTAVSTLAEQAKVQPLFDFVDKFLADLTVTASASAPTDGRTALKAFAKSDGLAQKADKLDLNMRAPTDSTTVGQIKTYFSNSKTRAEALSKDNKSMFDTSAPAWKTELTNTYNAVDEFLVQSQSGLSGNATCALQGTCFGQTRDGIETSRKEIKEAYDAAIAAWNVAPTGPSITAPQDTNVRALFNPEVGNPGAPDVKKETEAEKEKRLDDFLAQGKEKGVRKIEEKERVNLDDIDLTALFNSQTGKLLNGDDAKEALESLNKFLAEIMTSLKGDSKKPVPLKTKKEKADSIINELVEKFTEAYDGEDPEDEDDAKKKKALTVAKNKAVAAAKDAITTKVYKAFGINVQKTSGIKGQGLKKGIGVKNNTRGRNRARGSSRIKVNRGRKGQKNETVEKNDTVQKDRRGKRGAMGRRGRTKASNKSEE